MATDSSTQYGPLIAIGGAEDKDTEPEILSRVCELAPSDRQEVVVIAAASGIPEEVLPAYNDVFDRLGASRVHGLSMREREEASDPENIRLIERAGVVFFTGGDQLRLTSMIGGTPLHDAIREHYAGGGVLAGTSAGAMAMPKTMIYNGGDTDALRKGGVNMSAGLGFVEGLIIDSHFLERGRFTRLMAVCATHPEHLGIGVGEDAAVRVHSDRVLEAMGPGHVIIMDTRGLMKSNIMDLAMDEPIAVENVTMHALTSGHGYDIDERRYLNADELQARVERTA